MLSVYLLFSLPFFQKWIAGKASDFLSEYLRTRVSIERVKIGFLGRLIIDDLHVWDQQNRPMLFVTRTAAQVDVGEYLTNGNVIINSAQLFGADIHAYKQHPDSAYNFQFVIDAFASKDTTEKPLPHIEVHTILVRHTNLSLDNQWRERKTGHFDPNHLAVHGLSMKASLDILTTDTINATLYKLSFEEQSGIKVTEGHGELAHGKNSAWTVSNLRLAMPDSYLQSSRLTYDKGEIGGSLTARLSATDFTPFYQPLRHVDDVFTLELDAQTDQKDMRIAALHLSDDREALNLQAKAHLTGLKDSTLHIDTDIDKLFFSKNLSEVVEPLLASIDSTQQMRNGKFRQPLQLLSKVEGAELNGHISTDKNATIADMHLTSSLGDIDINGTYRKNQLKAHAELAQFQAGQLLSAFQDSASVMLGSISAVIDLDGKLNGQGNAPEGTLKASISELQFKDYTYQNIKADIKRQGTLISSTINANDPSLLLNSEFRINTSNSSPLAIGYADIENVDFHHTHLLSSSKIQKLKTKIGIDFEGNELKNMAGILSIPHIIITDDKGSYTLDNIQLESRPDGDERHVTFTSPYATAQADGIFDPFTLGAYLQQLAHNWLPDIFKASSQKYDATQAKFQATVTDLSPLQHFFDTDIAFDKGALAISANMDSEQRILNAQASTPSLKWGSEELLNIDLRLNDSPLSMHSQVHFDRIMKGDPVAVDFDIRTEDNKLNTKFEWDNHKDIKNRGTIQLRGSLEHNTATGLAATAEVIPTELFINDTLWTVSPAQLYYRNKELYVDNFKLSMAGGNERSLRINGTASANADANIFVDLKNIDLAYIFTLAKVKPISLGGYATGRITGQHVFRQPEAYGAVDVPHFLFNNAHMGALHCALGWGQTPGTLTLDGHVEDPQEASTMDIDGYLHLVKDPVQHMNLDIDFTRANAAFMQRYVGNIMKDFDGRVSGRLNIGGKFREIDLNGDVKVHECGLTIPSLNVRYHAYDETVHLRPTGVYINNIKGHDSEWKPGMTEHSANISGQITYEHFRDMHYNFDIDGTHIMAYNTHEFGDMPFYSTAYGTGHVNINGGPGYVSIDIDATPTRGTTLTYNASSPETITNAGFLSFVDRSKQLQEALEGKEEDAEVKPTSDMNINFNLNLTPEAQLRLLMDPRTDDYISLYGTSHLKCTYYNKGSFKMYGTYYVDRGTYKMTLQDVIHKDFQFRKGGTIIFGGNPFNADLGLQAVYTVPSVSLNDLSARGTFSNSTVRVNCIMNLGGQAGSPRVTFDFDIPNVNEDELRMVRSLISTEEERNMQVIYLLGIGRFYTYDYTGSQAQSSTAMNSLLSSTLSGQLNQMLNNMTGSSNWNIGANLSTGTTGWSDMDVEGMLSGRLLNNRLLINGNFGYRDNPVAASNFIGDFDLQWLLTKNGNLVLKAYSETNDRYFTKSSLTTQGVGIMVKKDFNNLGDLFHFLRKKKTDKEPNKQNGQADSLQTDKKMVKENNE